MEALPVIDVSALLDGRAAGSNPDSRTNTDSRTNPDSRTNTDSRAGTRYQPDTGTGAMDVAGLIDAACRDHGFFLVTGHGIDPSLQDRLDKAFREFFAQNDRVKELVSMRRGGRAWRGWFPLGGELTSGRPDHKEGYYFGAELPIDDPRVKAGLPLHGSNLFPAEPVELRAIVLEWIDAMTVLGQSLMGGVALGLGLDQAWFERELTADPTVLFRAFRYPPVITPTSVDHGETAAARNETHTFRPDTNDTATQDTDTHDTDTHDTDTHDTDTRDANTPSPCIGVRPENLGEGAAIVGPWTEKAGERWGVAEHTDYGLLTILAQDGSGGLQVRSGDGWIDVPPLAGAFVCNIGDMLDRMTGGRYRSTPHRVRATETDRLSFPFFFDPSWDAEVAPLPLDGDPPTDDALMRWDATSVHEYRGSYGEYLTAKVAKVFPTLFDATI